MCLHYRSLLLSTRAILEYDAKKQIVNADIVRKVIDTTHEYMTKENDLRGYVAHKGRAHAASTWGRFVRFPYQTSISNRR